MLKIDPNGSFTGARFTLDNTTIILSFIQVQQLFCDTQQLINIGVEGASKVTVGETPLVLDHAEWLFAHKVMSHIIVEYMRPFAEELEKEKRAKALH